LIVRRVEPEDHPAWVAMRVRLWPDEDPEELAGEVGAMRETVFVAEAGGTLIGFIEIGIRSYAEGGPSGPAPYVEGIWVEPEYRRRGVARAMLDTAERWSRGQGFTYLGSDALLDNELSHAWHKAAGFAEIERIVIFGKTLP
jgi:aminoglycoside 6'-N-acetyltransferase I